MKRELESLAGDHEVDAPRTKRRKEQLTAAQLPIATTTENANASNDEEKLDMSGSSADQGTLKEQAMRLWQVVRDAVNKEGNICSPPFIRLPLKRQYPDYYFVIAQPICLDDIKKKIDDGRYPSLDDVRQDFELCFTNAKRYNMKDSPIWLDAKFLLKVANKEFSKITGKKVKKSGEDEDNGEEKGEGEGDDDKRRNKPPNMNRLLKARLQKLVEKTDEETHRVLSDAFMEMPSKKDYPTYYKEIKRPICIETIFKRLKRKEYSTSEEFANDVELVFSNALTFNQDHSQIWEDAVTLRDYFRQLMSDLPPPYALSRYMKATGKIKLKVPGGATTTITASTSSPQGTGVSKDQPATQAPLTLRLPAASSVITTKIPARPSEPSPQASTSAAPAAPAPSPVPTPISVPAPAAAQAPPSVPVSATPVTPSPSIQTPNVVVLPKIAAPTPKVAAQPLTYATPTQYTHYPNAAYRQSTQTTATPQSSTVTSTSSTKQHTAHSVSRSPAPSLSGHRPLATVLIVTKPRGRPLWLDYRDGVKSWALRLGQGEQSLSIVDVKFLREEDGDSSEEEARDDAEGAEEAEEPTPKKRGRGRPARGGKAKGSASGKKEVHVPKKSQAATTPPRENIQVVLNGTPASAKADQGIWEIELQTGTNVLEVGEKGGHTWKVHMERSSVV